MQLKKVRDVLIGVRVVNGTPRKFMSRHCSACLLILGKNRSIRMLKQRKFY